VNRCPVRRARADVRDQPARRSLRSPWRPRLALVGEAGPASDHQVSLGRCRRGLRGPVVLASLAERVTPWKAATIRG
jgi:hypothetical protein